MTTEESKVLSIIWNWGGEASVDIIAREAGISINYARLFCESLGKEDYIDFIRSKLCKIKNKGKLSATRAGKRGQNFTPYRNKVSGMGPRKIIVPLGKKGRFLLNY